MRPQLRWRTVLPAPQLQSYFQRRVALSEASLSAAQVPTFRISAICPAFAFQLFAHLLHFCCTGRSPVNVLCFIKAVEMAEAYIWLTVEFSKVLTRYAGFAVRIRRLWGGSVTK